MEYTITIKLDASETLVHCIETLAAAMGAPREQQPAKAEVKQQPKKQATPKEEMPKAEAPKAEAPKAEAPKAEAPKTEEPKAEAPKQPQLPLFPTMDEVRAAMNAARLRIEGTDYETAAERPMKRSLNNEFKRLAALGGADKPSTLPEEQRQSFIEACNHLYLKDGSIASTQDDTPF